MFKFLKSNNPVYFLFISSFILFFSVINHILLNSQEIIWPFSSVINLNKYFFYFAYTAILLFSAIKTNIIINKSVFFQKTNYATGLIYIAIASSIYPLHLSIKPLLANLFCLLALENLLKIYRNKTCKIQIFNASCWLLTSALFVGNTIFIFPIIWITLYFIRPFNWREYIMPFIALFFISIYIFVLLFYFGDFNFWIENDYQNLKHFQPIKSDNWWYFGIVLLLGFIISSRTLFLSFIRSNNRYKKITWVFINLFFCCILQSLSEYIFLKNSQPLLSGFLIPFSVILSNTIINTKISWLIHCFIFISVVGYFVVTYVI